MVRALQVRPTLLRTGVVLGAVHFDVELQLLAGHGQVDVLVAVVLFQFDVHAPKPQGKIEFLTIGGYARLVSLVPLLAFFAEYKKLFELI